MATLIFVSADRNTEGDGGTANYVEPNQTASNKQPILGPFVLTPWSKDLDKCLYCQMGGATDLRS